MADTSIKYKPLYDLLLRDQVTENRHLLSDELKEYFDKLSKVSVIIITGGRFSGKSYEVAEWNIEATLQYEFSTVYARFTNTSIGDSILNEVTEKIDKNNLNNFFDVSKSGIKLKDSNANITFKGIKTSSKDQKGNLKSLKGFNVSIIEEAEDVPNFETFERLYLSIRSPTKQNLNILILNPTTVEHWIYKQYFKKRDVPSGFNGIKDDVMYIHTSYLDVNPKYVPEGILRTYNRMKVEDPERYNHIVMGGWITDLKGALWQRSELNYFNLEELNTYNTEFVISAIDVADEGIDSLSMPIGYFINNKIYITDWVFTKENTETTIPLCSQKTRQHKIKFLGIETNSIGASFSKQMQNEVKSGTSIINKFQTQNKHQRIVAKAHFIRNHFVFRKDIEYGSDYDVAMNEFLNYMKDKRDNSHDDAADSLSFLASLIEDLMPNNFY